MADPTPQLVSEENEVRSVPAAIAYADPSTPTAEHLALRSGVTRGDVATLTVRILGIYVAFQGLSIVGIIFRFNFRLDVSSATLITFLAVLEAIAAAMIIKAPRIGAWLLPKSPITSNTLPTVGWPLELQSVAFSVVGVVMAAWALPEIAFDFWRSADLSIESLTHGVWPDLFSELLRPAVQFVIGAWLFFGSKRLALYWRRTRAERPAPHDDSGPL